MFRFRQLYFNVQMVSGDLEKISDTISKARVRIFYKGENRNGGFITEEFADKLLSTIAYTPLKGIYDFETGDYTDHGAERSEGRIYGVVPDEYNLSWETHLDDDGVERIYACVDVLIYTALYEEAKQILGKGLSMELYKNTLQGNWRLINGGRYFVYTDGCFLGLQVLGEDIEPCFEGAGIFSKLSKLQQLTGGKLMYTQEQLREILFGLVNPNYEENNSCDNYILHIGENFCIYQTVNEQQFKYVEFSVDEEGQVSLGEVTDYEINFNAASDIAALNEQIATITTEKENLNTQIEECQLQISTLQTENDKLNEEGNDLKTNIESLNAQLDELNTYKLNIEREQKKEKISRYDGLLSEEQLEQFTQKLDEYSVEELSKELSFAYTESNPSLFSKETGGKFPKEEEVDPLLSVLDRYENS